jgi:hypothetical protein
MSNHTACAVKINVLRVTSRCDGKIFAGEELKKKFVMTVKRLRGFSSRGLEKKALAEKPALHC